MIWRRAYVWRWGGVWGASALLNRSDPWSRDFKYFVTWREAMNWALDPRDLS
jgi:hypothetical protein